MILDAVVSQFSFSDCQKQAQGRSLSSSSRSSASSSSLQSSERVKRLFSSITTASSVALVKSLVVSKGSFRASLARVKRAKKRLMQHWIVAIAFQVFHVLSLTVSISYHIHAHLTVVLKSAQARWVVAKKRSTSQLEERRSCCAQPRGGRAGDGACWWIEIVADLEDSAIMCLFV